MATGCRSTPTATSSSTSSAPSTQTPTFGRNVSTTTTDPGVLNGWGKRGYNMEYSVAAQHQIADRMSVNGGYYRRTFGNQTFTDDLRYDASSYDSFCIRAPVDPDLPGGGGYHGLRRHGSEAGGVRAGPAGQQPDSLLGRLRR